jgi:hypothetical protein
VLAGQRPTCCIGHEYPVGSSTRKPEKVIHLEEEKAAQ